LPTPSKPRTPDQGKSGRKAGGPSPPRADAAPIVQLADEPSPEVIPIYLRPREMAFAPSVAQGAAAEAAARHDMLVDVLARGLSVQLAAALRPAVSAALRSLTPSALALLPTTSPPPFEGLPTLE
jgi:hypothetical protein